MNSKILILAFAALYQVSAQQPTVFPNPFGATGFPSALGSFNTNWARPYYTAAAEGWRTYLEQLQQARNQLFQTLSALQSNAQNGDLKPPAIELPNRPQSQIVQTATRPTLPQIQNDAQNVRPQQGQVVNTPALTQGQTGTRQPQTVAHQTVTSGTRPLTAQVTSGSVPQVAPIVPQVNAQVPWVGK